METGGRFGWKILLMVALMTAGMGGALDAEATDCALAITDWEEYCCVEKVDEWSGTVKCTLTGVAKQENIDEDLIAVWDDPAPGSPFTIEGTRESADETVLYLDLGLESGTTADEYTANVTFKGYYKSVKPENLVCDGKIKVDVTVFKVEFLKMWSDQFPGIVQNFLPGNSGRANYNYIMMGARDKNKLYAKAKVDITPDSYTLESNLQFNWAGVKDDGTLVIDYVNNAALEYSKDIVSIYSGEKKEEDHAFVVGLDVENDGLNLEDVCAISEYRFKPVTQAEYLIGKSALANLGWALFYPTASTFIDTFVNDSYPNGSGPAVIIDIKANIPTHNTGAVFDSNGGGEIKKHPYDSSSALANRIYTSTDFQDELISVFNSKRTQVQNHFSGNPDDPEEPFTWDLPDLIEFEDNSIKSEDLHYAFHGAPLNGTVQVTVQNDLTVSEVHTDGMITDLYDFDYEAVSPATQAARVQAGYNTLGHGGHIFRVEVDIDKVDNGINYSFQ